MFFSRISNQSHSRPLNFLIVGAGLAGKLLAKQLLSLGIHCEVIEKMPLLHAGGAGIALPANAVRGLRRLGLGAVLDRYAHRVHAISYTDEQGRLLSRATLDKAPLNLDHFVAISRERLSQLLWLEADCPITFSTSISTLQQTSDGVRVTFDDWQCTSAVFDAVIGADGIHSTVRQLALPAVPITDLGVATWRWIGQYPALKSLEPIYMFDGKQRSMFMAYPVGPKEVYCYAHLPEITRASHLPMARKRLSEQFSHYGCVAKHLLHALPEEVIFGRLRSLSEPVFGAGRVALIGDAAHASSPMLQQGVASALEDILALSCFLKHFPVPEAFAHYRQFRTEAARHVMTVSDGPMRALVQASARDFLLLQQNIRDHGPLNVQGWNRLFLRDPAKELSHYIEERMRLREYHRMRAW